MFADVFKKKHPISEKREAGYVDQDSLGEEHLIRSARAGDLDAFNELVITYQDSLYGWILTLVNDEALADDLTQATLITAYEKLSTFRGGSFRAWLYKIARNRSVDEFRHRKRHPLISLDMPSDEDDDRDLISDIPGEFMLPEEEVLRSEQAGLISLLLERLPEEACQVLQLVDVDGFNYEEASSLLKIPLGTVKSRLTRARLKFRKLLEEERTLTSID